MMTLDELADWIARHPEVESVTLTEVVTTILTPTVTPAMMNQIERSELWWLQ
jgi:hypothetical protein